MQDKRKVLDTSKKAAEIEKIEKELFSNIIGQEQPILKISDALTKVFSGLKKPERPILTLLFLGPTGVGKTETVKVLTQYLLGSRTRFTRINCQEFSSEFNVSKLLGSPPGYVGNDIEPLLSQRNIDKHWKDAIKNKEGVFSNPESKLCKMYSGRDFINIILFDEIEKAHPKFWTTLLSIMDDGVATMANNKQTNFTQSIIIMTSNVGSKEMQISLNTSSLGFDLNSSVEKNEVKDVALEKAKDTFPPEFCNRFDDIIVFNSLTEKDVSEILEVELRNFYNNLLIHSIPLLINFRDSAKNIIVKQGYSVEFGARNLNRAIDKLLISPLSRLISSEEILPGDQIEIKANDNNSELIFVREARGNPDKIVKPKTKKIYPPKERKYRGRTGIKNTLANSES
jgi:ATP-dependent Clp protease ATP-binding subunit ClpA